MAPLAKTYVTPQEYLALDRQSQEKSEYYNGDVYAMTGASREHNLIALNIAASLHTQLREGPCEVYQSDMRVRVQRPWSYFFPDVAVVCGEPRVEDDQGDILLNPTVVVEVLPPSTERFDRGQKLDAYRQIESLQAYLLVAQDQVKLLLFARRPDNTWLLSDAASLDDVVRLDVIGCALPLAEVYRKVELPVEE